LRCLQLHAVEEHRLLWRGQPSKQTRSKEEEVRPQGGREVTSTAPLVKRKRRRGMGIDRSPGFLTYGLLGAFVLGNAYPLWWSFVVGSGTNATRGETFPLIPGGNFISNMGKVLDAIPFWKALVN